MGTGHQRVGQVNTAEGDEGEAHSNNGTIPLETLERLVIAGALFSGHGNALSKGFEEVSARERVHCE